MQREVSCLSFNTETEMVQGFLSSKLNKSRTDLKHFVFSLYISIHIGQDFCYIWWLLKEPFCFVSQSLFKLWLSSRSSWVEVQPGCWEEHLPVRW